MGAKHLAICAALVASACFAQDVNKGEEKVKESGKVQTAVKVEQADQRFFRLDFGLKEVEGGKVLNARSYSTYSGTSAPPSSIRTGVKIQEGDAGHPNWTEIGVRIDVRGLREWQTQVAF